MLTELKLINWKTHKNSTFSFQKGVNLLIGIIGAGKSSVADAISYALFGTFPDLNRRKIKLTDLIMKNNYNSKESCSVELSFYIENENYKIIRKINENGNSEAIFEKNNVIILEQPTKVSEEVENILKINYDTFSKAIYSEQNKLNYFLDLTKSERKNQIDEMLGLNQFSIAENNATSLINDIKKSISTQEEDILQIDVSQIKEVYNNLKNEVEKNEVEKNELIKKLKQESQKLQDRTIEYEKLKKRNELKKRIWENIIKIKSTIKVLEKERDGLLIDFDEEKLRKENELEIINRDKKKSELNENRVKERINNRKLGEIKNIIETAKINIKQKTELIKKLKLYNEEDIGSEIEENKNLINELINKQAYLETLKIETQKSIKKLEESTEKCPVCDRELEEKFRLNLITRKKQILDNTKNNFKEINENLIKEKEKEIELKKIHEDMAQIKNKILEFNNSDKILDESKQKEEILIKIAANLDNEVKEQELVVNNIDKSINEIDKKLEKINKKKEIVKNLEESNKQLAISEMEHKEINIDEKEIEKLNNELNEYKILISSLGAKVEADEKYITNLHQQIQDKEKEIEKFAQIQEKIKIKKQKLNNLNKFKKALLEIQIQLRDRLILSVNKLMVNLWSELYPYKNYSSIRLVPKIDDYLIEINYKINDADENWLQIDSIASGGEKSISSLTLRIALSMILVPNLKLLVLDEPTHNLDSQAIESFIDVIGNTLPNIIEQIFVITHDENLKQMNSANIYILDRDKNNNKPTKLIPA